MESLIRLLTRFGDKFSSLGALVSAMGCAMCFPAIATLGASLGLGFLTQWEGLFISTLLPLFAWLALILNALGWFSHRQCYRSALGMIGPIVLLLTFHFWFQESWRSEVIYSALGLMVAVSIWDIFSPANKRCDDDSCAV